MKILLGTEVDSGKPVEVDDTALRMHTSIFGGSGYGKSYLSYLMLREQLKNGASLLAIDPEMDTIKNLRGLCQEADIPPKQVIVLEPGNALFTPPLNPFRTGEDPVTVVNEIMRALALENSNAPRAKMYVRNSMVMAAWYGLGLQDVLRFLIDDAFRDSVLSVEPLHDATAAPYLKSRDFFRERYLKFDKKERESSVNSAELRFDEVLGHTFFARAFNVPSNAVDFGTFFTQQHVVLAHVGEGSTLSSEGVRILGSLLVNFLNAASASREGNRPVILAIDEAKELMEAIPEVFAKITNRARKRDIRLLVATQHIDQIPYDLKRDLFASTAVKAFFRAEGEEAVPTALYLERKMQPPPPPNMPPFSESPLYVACADGRVVPLAAVKGYPEQHLYPVDPANPGEVLDWFCAWTNEAVTDVLLENGESAWEVFPALPEGCVEVGWQGCFALAIFTAPRPPKLPSRREWERRVANLPQGHAIMVLGNGNPVTVQTTHVTPPKDASPDYIAATRERFRYVPPPPPAPDVPPAPTSEAPTTVVTLSVVDSERDPRGID